MGKSEKKHGKGRLDHYYRLAKERGYRARSAFKIIQLNQKYGFFAPQRKNRPMCIIDLCAAPGGWLQVAQQSCPVNSLIVGVDLAPIKPIPNVISFQSDITTDHCRSQLRGYLKTWKADIIMHDGAPNVGMAWTQDAFSQAELVLQSFRLATEFLQPGGWFVTKVFRSKDYNKLMWVFNQFFGKCEATKPPSSRNVSAEIFVVCKGYTAPKHIDPRLLDSSYVFEDLEEPSLNAQQRVYNPEKKQRKRDGYDEENFLQFKRRPVLDFLHAQDPVKMLAETTEFDWNKELPEVKSLEQLPQTTKDLKECFKDLKVLGKKDFRMILKWRMHGRKHLGLEKAPEPKPEPAPLSQDEKIEKELEETQQSIDARKKRERRRRNEMKQREIKRMQLGMTAPEGMGIEEHDDLFDLNRVERLGAAESLVQGHQKAPVLGKSYDDIVLESGMDQNPSFSDNESAGSGDDAAENEPEDSDSEDERLADELDNMYDAYQERQSKTAEQRALKERKQEQWDGFESSEDNSLDSASDSEADDDVPEKEQISNKAAMFFDNPAFKDLAVDSSESEHDTSDESELGAEESESEPTSEAQTPPNEEEPFDPTKMENPEDQAIRMTLAHQLATGQITKHDLENEGYNKISFRDTEGLPQWFLDDEKKHTKLTKPVTKEAVAAYREQLKALNARPIKKVAEAQARKRMRAQRKFEKLRKKSDVIADDASKTEREKSDEIGKLLRRAHTKEKPKITVVAAKGINRGLKGRPMGVRGKYKMVDGRMKKEMRALKRADKKKR